MNADLRLGLVILTAPLWGPVWLLGWAVRRCAEEVELRREVAEDALRAARLAECKAAGHAIDRFMGGCRTCTNEALAGIGERIRRGLRDA